MSDNDDGSTNTDPDDALTKLQAKLTEVGARERNKGKTAGRKEVLAALGFDGKTVEEATAAMEALRSRDGDQTELQKNYEKAVAEAEGLKAQVAVSSLRGDIVSALVGEDVKGDRLAAATNLVAAELADLPKLPDTEAITAAVQEFKTGVPELFAAPDSNANGDGSNDDQQQQGAGQTNSIPVISGAGPGPAGNRGGTQDADKRGRDMVDRLFAKELAASKAAAGHPPSSGDDF